MPYTTPIRPKPVNSIARNRSMLKLGRNSGSILDLRYFFKGNRNAAKAKETRAQDSTINVSE
jgi:hypothetical protein